MTLPASTRLGAYEVLAFLGAGGMGEVYRARDTRLGREVALKVLPEELASDRERLFRFEQEARSASALNHPNIVTIHEIGREGETAFIAMELVEGKTLRELSASGPMPVRKILGVAAQVADGLAKAHGAGIVHRDMKPENVMVSKDGFVKILDFGLAKLIEPDSGEFSGMPTLVRPETHPGTVMGTVGYMSPEQASGEPLDFRSDQFSLGSIVYEMTTGQKAFQRKTAAETMSAIIRDEPEPVAKLRPELPLPVRWILERCLAKDKEERYASTRDLARDLASVRDHISEVSSGVEAMLAGPARSRRGVKSVALGLALAAAALAAGWALARGTAKKSAAASFKRLTFRQGGLGNARFAPDGQTIFYGASWEGESMRRLYQTRPESPESRELEFPGDILSISNTGELAIQLNVRGSTATLARVPMSGGVPREVLEDVAYAGADFSPDGKQLAVVHVVDGKSRLEFPIGHVLVPAGVDSPRFSPGGDFIAFYETGADSISISLIDRLGKTKKALSSGWNFVSGAPCWTPDGREIWFTASQAGQTEALWSVDRSGRRRLVTRVPGTLELDDIARNGGVLLAHHLPLHSLKGLAPGESKERDLSWLDASFPSDLSSDGRTLLLTEQQEGAGPVPVIYLRNTNGAPAVRLGEGFGLALSPDTKWVLTGLLRPAHLSLLPTGPGEAKNLDADGLREFSWGAFTPDGRRVVFSAAGKDDQSRLYVQDVAGGKPRAITESVARLQPASSPVSPDGRRVFALKAGKVVIFSIDGGEPRPIPGLPPGDIPMQWSLDGRSLYVYRREVPVKVWLVDVDTGEKRLWKEIPVETAGRGLRLRITPDGKSYVYRTIRTFSALYLVEGLR